MTRGRKLNAQRHDAISAVFMTLENAHKEMKDEHRDLIIATQRVRDELQSERGRLKEEAQKLELMQQDLKRQKK